MRSILLILILAIVALIIAFASGFLHLNQTREASAPSVAASGNGATATGGRTPAFEVETGSVAVGTRQKDVRVAVPEVRVNRPVDANVDGNSAAK